VTRVVYRVPLSPDPIAAACQKRPKIPSTATRTRTQNIAGDAYQGDPIDGYFYFAVLTILTQMGRTLGSAEVSPKNSDSKKGRILQRRVRVTVTGEQSGASGMLSQTRSSGSLGARLHL